MKQFLKPEGAHALMQSGQERQKKINALMNGSVDIYTYLQPAAVCYHATAFVRCLLGRIDQDDLLDAGSSPPAMYNLLGFTHGVGLLASQLQNIPLGAALGFFSLARGGFVHAAVHVGFGRVRSVNGLLLGNGWQIEGDLTRALTLAGPGPARFTCAPDGTLMDVYVLA